MIELTPDLAPHVIIAEAHGTVSARDYQEVLIPAVTAADTDGRPLRMLYVLAPDFEGFEAEAALDDGRLGLGHWRELERIGLVTDHEVYRVMTRALGFLMPGQVRVFALADRDAAREWVTGD